MTDSAAPRSNIIHLRSSRHLRLLLTLERTRRSLQAARADIAEARTHSSSLTERLHEREEFAHAILDGIDLGIVTADPFGMVTFVNQSAKRLLNLTQSREQDGRVADLLGLDQNPHDLLGDQDTRFLEYPLSTNEGEELDLELSVSRASGTGHAQIGFFFIFRDMRDEKARSIERARLERLAAIGTMVAGFAHEVRNPVASLRSLAESLSEELSDRKLELPHVDRMLQVLERIERLVRTALQFGRPAAPRRESCRPWAILAAALDELEPRTRSLEGDFRMKLDPELPEVFVDDTQLAQVLVILLNNAIDSVGTPKRVLIQATRGRAAVLDARERSARDSQPPSNQPVVRFEIHDDGPGIPPDMIGRIFDPFFTTKPAGTGLGLSIAQQIVSENQGTIEVSSQRGSTTFAVLVPISP